MNALFLNSHDGEMDHLNLDVIIQSEVQKRKFVLVTTPNSIYSNVYIPQGGAIQNGCHWRLIMRGQIIAS